MAAECGVAAVVIVGVQELGVGRGALVLAGVGTGVGPFFEQGPVEPFDLSIGLGPVGAGAFMHDVLAEGDLPVLGAVGTPLSVSTRETVIPWAANQAWARVQNAAAVCLCSSSRISE